MVAGARGFIDKTMIEPWFGVIAVATKSINYGWALRRQRNSGIKQSDHELIFE